jgi:ATP-dependent helicase/nuclease subunit A
MDVKFTTEQQAVIDARDSNILVSAAAGSGKTAVLVERIIKMVESGLDVDHLLVVTFTKAAASQMKAKITQAIQKSLSKDPENAHLQKQETLIHNAQITTIDSFCQYIIRNNFNAIGLDPSFRVADEGELKIIREDTMAELLEDEYASAGDVQDSDFLFCMDYFNPGSNDKRIEEYINQLFKFSMSMPWPEDWLEERAYDYGESSDSFDEFVWVKDCVTYARRILKEASDTLKSAAEISQEPDGPYMYQDALESDKASIDAALQYNTYDALFMGVRGITFGKLPGKKDDSVNPEKREYVKGIRNGLKGEIEDLKEKYFVLPSDTVIAQMKLCDRAVKELCRLTLEFKKRFDLKKRLMQLIDFPDMEHFALQILVDHDRNEPSDIALEYRDFYREVLIDEYQDSNSVQEMILMAIAGKEAGISERFMVGDVKQSIYKFRLARPEIFMEKFHAYDRSEGASDRRIDLHKNFRSRSQVLDITNYIFEKIMGEDLGGVEYDEDARLVAGAEFDEPVMDVSPEILLLDGTQLLDDGDESGIADLSDREKEALMVAERIMRLRKENPDLKYSDIVILLRSLSGWDDVFKDVLESQGIPVYIESKSGYFEAPEVAVLMQLLSVLDNPRQDIPLVSVMHSDLGGFSDEELAIIKTAINENKEGRECDSFYEGMCSDIALPEDLSGKLSSFLDMIDRFRIMTTYTPVHELLLDILEETDFENIVSALPGGVQRRANVEMLLGYAVNFEKTSFKGLFHFVRYIEHMRVSMVDYGEAGVIDENADVVRIMSIHKSKGLEFPVVFVSGLSKKFNRMDTKGDLILDMDLGIGVKHINTELRVKYDTLKRQIIADKMELDSLGEEIRVLYVALTRAKEKLILSGFISDLPKELSKAVKMMPMLGNKAALLPYSTRSRADSYMDLILPAIIRHPGFRDIVDKYSLDTQDFDRYSDKGTVPFFAVRVLGEKDLKDEMVRSAAGGILREEELIREFDEDFDRDLYERLMSRFNAKYAHENLKGLFTKTTVSDLKKAELERVLSVSDNEDENIEEGWFEESETVRPKGRVGGAERGTAYHRVMELLDDEIYADEALMRDSLSEAGDAAAGNSEPGPVSKRIYSWIKRTEERGRISEEGAKSVWTPDITAFLASDVGQRMGAAFRRGQLTREKPFMMGVSAKELDPLFPEDEMVLVQGIIDAFFEEDGELVLLDYKTDRVYEEKKLADMYRVQLDLYKRALEAATGKKVKESLIYSFAQHRQIRLDNV